ncbi:hypothetical protein BGZ79_008003 [Entomortierella chlamydospora]|nr:hypothetical protein BGZ79_008003 [Entomortierella chlamydospora]
MSGGACAFFRHNNPGLLRDAESACIMRNIEKHPCTSILKEYADVILENGVEYLQRRLAVDLGLLNAEILEGETVSDAADIRDRTLKVLLMLCDFIINPPFKNTQPSENDVLLLWVNLFSKLTKQVSINTGEKAMLASKIIRQMQSSEFGDPSDMGRRADCLFMFDDIEISNIEFKKPSTSEAEIGLQNRKNVRLGRCLQQGFVEFGVAEPSVVMADVAGYVAVFYQVKQMGDLHVAGKITPHLVQLPSTDGALWEFLTSPSLAIIWNYLDHLEKQGPKLRMIKRKHEVSISKQKMEQGLSRAKSETTVIRKFEDNVVFSPPRKKIINAQ